MMNDAHSTGVNMKHKEMMLIQNEVNNKTITRTQRVLWITHFLFGFVVLVLGVKRNGGR